MLLNLIHPMLLLVALTACNTADDSHKVVLLCNYCNAKTYKSPDLSALRQQAGSGQDPRDCLSTCLHQIM